MKKYSKELIEHRKNNPTGSENFVGKIKAPQMMYKDYLKIEQEKKARKLLEELCKKRKEN